MVSQNAGRLRAVRSEDALDVAAVHARLALRVPALVGRSAPSVRQFSSGASNLTHLLTRTLPEGVELSPEQARVLGETTFDTLADLHSIDVDAAGLADLSRGPGYVRRQVEGWSRRFRGALTDDVPPAEELMGRLTEHQPDDVRASLLHGDWKLDDLVLDPSGTPRITGVLDGETATVADPLTGLGASLAHWVTADDDEEFGLISHQSSVLPGMPTREELVERYLARTGLRTPDRTSCEVLGLFRLAVILHRIWARYRAGHSTNPRSANVGFATAVPLERAEEVAGCR